MLDVTADNKLNRYIYSVYERTCTGQAKVRWRLPEVTKQGYKHYNPRLVSQPYVHGIK